ncbi:MAG: LamG-like jellyroll fold domain-containing protein, partial [Candidatus Hodarchaeota archaeon]
MKSSKLLKSNILSCFLLFIMVLLFPTFIFTAYDPLNPRIIEKDLSQTFEDSTRSVPTITSPPDFQFQKSDVNNGIGLDGLNDYVNCGNDASLQIIGEITVEAWFKADSTGSDQGLVAKGMFFAGAAHDDYGAYALAIASNGAIYWDLYFSDGGTGIERKGVSYLPTGGLQIGRWYHVVGTWDGTTNGQSIKLYVNGVKKGTNTPSSGYSQLRNPGYNLNLGRNPSGMYDYFYYDGAIDEVRILNKALSDSEIQEDYLAFGHYPQRYPDSTVAWYHFDEGIRSSIKDSSGNGNSGTGYGTAWVSGIEHNRNALDFNGSSDYINCGNDVSLQITGPITVEIWFKIDSLNRYQVLLAKGFIFSGTLSIASYAIGITNTNILYWDLYFNDGSGNYDRKAATGQPPGGFQTGRWYHAVGIWDGTTNTDSIKLY